MWLSISPGVATIARFYNDKSTGIVGEKRNGNFRAHVPVSFVASTVFAVEHRSFTQQIVLTATNCYAALPEGSTVSIGPTKTIDDSDDAELRAITVEFSIAI
jgi:hypothetical protein